MELRPYQRELVEKIRNELRDGKKAVCAVLGCGGGKSVIQGCIARSATDKGNRVLFLVHRRELLEQISRTFRECGVDMHLCTVGMVQTVTRRIKAMEMPGLIITDECHHSAAKSYINIYEAFPCAVRLGFTATPVRLGMGGLGSVYDSLVEGVSTGWLIDNGYLSPYEYYSVKTVDTENLRVRAGEFVSEEISKILERGYVYGEAVSTWKRIAEGKRTIVYCSSIKASKETAEEFLKNGVIAAHLDGTTPEGLREKTVQLFRDGKISVLCNVDLFGEGFDVPDCECVCLMRPTMSLSLYIQQSMRSMRYRRGKTAIIIDHVGNVYRHGLPDDVREWTLKEKKRGEARQTIRQCPVCLRCVKASVSVCPECGAELKQNETERTRKEKETVEAELERIRREDLKKKPYSAYKDIKTFEDMRELRKAKGYKFPWEIHKCIELGIAIPPKYNGILWRMKEHAKTRRA